MTKVLDPNDDILLNKLGLQELESFCEFVLAHVLLLLFIVHVESWIFVGILEQDVELDVIVVVLFAVALIRCQG